jgi:hypothetical protein
VVTSFYQSSANHVYFYALFNLRNLSYIIFVSNDLEMTDARMATVGEKLLNADIK